MVGKNFTEVVGSGCVANEYAYYLPSYGDYSKSSCNKRGGGASSYVAALLT